jgi:metal-dependent amidase/aminoacylase/carboxypeptidase family protein
VKLTGTVRTYDPKTQDLIEVRLAEMVNGICAAHRATGEFVFKRGYPPVINTQNEVEFAHSVASEIWGEANCDANYTPSMGGEDFAYMLQKRPGCFSVIGQGAPGQPIVPLHNTRYDFCDEIIPNGVRYFSRVVERGLPL